MVTASSGTSPSTISRKAHLSDLFKYRHVSAWVAGSIPLPPSAGPPPSWTRLYQRSDSWAAIPIIRMLALSEFILSSYSANFSKVGACLLYTSDAADDLL